MMVIKMENKVCTKCGTENNSEALICKSCGSVLYNNKDKNIESDNNVIINKSNNDNNVNDNKENKKQGTIIGLISLFLFFGGGILFPIYSYNYTLPSYFDYVSPISIVLALILLIYVRIKYPKNKVGRITLGSIIIFIIIAVIMIIRLMNSCASSCEEGCNSCNDTASSGACD
jgi:ribosomal protein L40E